MTHGQRDELVRSFQDGNETNDITTLMRTVESGQRTKEVLVSCFYTQDDCDTHAGHFAPKQDGGDDNDKNRLCVCVRIILFVCFFLRFLCRQRNNWQESPLRQIIKKTTLDQLW